MRSSDKPKFELTDIDSHGVKQLIADFLNETRRLQAAIDASDADETKSPS